MGGDTLRSLHARTGQTGRPPARVPFAGIGDDTGSGALSSVEALLGLKPALAKDDDETTICKTISRSLTSGQREAVA